jgi:hypothetical protein
MQKFPSNHEIKSEENGKCLTHSTTCIYCRITLEEFGMIKINEVALFLMDDEIVGAEVTV